jgi:two-component system, OmpR family, heavy metal sensor histidine kinase CusS
VKPLGLRSKLTLLYSAIFTLLLAVIFIASYFLFKNQLEADLNNDLSDRMEALSGYIKFEKDTPVLKFDASDPEAGLFVRNATRYFQISNLETGLTVTQSPEMRLLGLSFVPEELQVIDRQSGPTDFKTDDGELRFLDERIVSPSGQNYIVQVGTSLEQVSLALRRFSELAFFLIPCAVVLAAITGWILAGGALTPMRRITHAAHEIEPTNITGRLPLTGANDEVDQLASTFNEALARIEKVVGELRQLSGSIAHELRTPLASLRGEAEIALLHAHTIEDFDKLARMIDQLLTLARAESGGIKFKLQPFDIGITIGEVVDTFSLIATTRDICLESNPGTNLIAMVESQWLENVLINLLDNAIKYTPAGGRVSIKGILESDFVCIEVRDSGQGIPPEALPHIFDRFYRVDVSRNKQVTGVGLGLSFVKWIVEEHGGTIHVTSQVNQGSTFVIRLPRAINAS